MLLENLGRSDEKDDFNSFLQRLIYLFLLGWHLVLCPAVKNGHSPSARPQGSTSRIYGNVPSTNYPYPISYLHLLSKIKLPKEFHTPDYPRQVFTLNPQLHFFVSTDGKKDCLVSLFKKRI